MPKAGATPFTTKSCMDKAPTLHSMQLECNKCYIKGFFKHISKTGDNTNRRRRKLFFLHFILHSRTDPRVEDSYSGPEWRIFPLYLMARHIVKHVIETKDNIKLNNNNKIKKYGALYEMRAKMKASGWSEDMIKEPESWVGKTRERLNHLDILFVLFCVISLYHSGSCHQGTLLNSKQLCQ